MDITYIYLDESGDLGFNFDNNGTQRYFVITILVCKNKNTIDHINTAVKRTIKNKLNSKKSKFSELKGTNTTLAIKKYFYKQLSPLLGWSIYSIVLDKYQLVAELINLPPEHRIYNYLSKEILRKVDLRKTKSLLLTVDKRKGKKGINEFNKYLSSHLEAMLPLNIIYNISHEHSHTNFLLQATDLFCWGVRRKYEYNDDAWYFSFKERLNLSKIDFFADIKKDGP